MPRVSLIEMAALGFSVVALAGCEREAKQTAPVQTEAGGTLAAAPAAQAAAHRDMALVRVLYAIPGGTVADVYSGDAVAFNQLGYRSLSPYRELPAEQTTFRLRPAGKDTAEPLAEEGEGLAAGKHYTVVILPGEKDHPAAMRVLSDDLVPPSEGKAKVRIVNASPDAGKVGVFVGGRTSALVKGVAVQTASDYAEIDPIQGTLEVRHDAKVVANVPNTNIEPGTLYTVFVMGRMADRRGLEALVTADRVERPTD
jgi:hypothetical protein